MSKGALFYKADLHIHSYGVGTGSYDVTDTMNTPQAIVDLAISKGLKVISITDHNQWLNSMAAVQYAYGKDILVVPGIEVSTTQGHLLIYFETIDLLQQFYGTLTFNAEKSLCNQSIVECLQKAEQLGGIGVLAHITLESGFENTIGRLGPHMEAIFQCHCLMGLEITRKEDAGLYTDSDTNTDHKHLLEVWRGMNDNKLHRDFAKLMSSDSHELTKLGNNIDGNNRLTRIKMASLSFRSFKLALLSSESRVRLEDYLPEQRPIITHVKLEGGLLDGVDIELSSNLTCIIGSRGAGKSTFLESIRETTGNESKSKLRDSDVWPQTILLDYSDEAGQHLQMQREKHALVVNRTDPAQGITSIPIESYGQGDTANTIQHCDENPQVIIDFLDSFLCLSTLKQQDDFYVEQLRSNQSEMNKLRVNLIALPAAQKNLENEKAKLKKLEQTKAADIVKYHNALIQERELRKSLIGDLRELVKTYSEILANRDVFDKVAAISEENIVVGKDFFANVKSIVDSFAGIVAAKSQELKDALKLKVDELNVQLQAWNAKEKEIQDKIDAKKEELTKQGIPFDLGQINQISKDIVDYEKTVKKLIDDQKKLEELQATRKELLTARLDNKKEITRQHLLFADKINRDLRNSVDDFSITVKYQENQYSAEFAEVLKQMMGWRTSQVPKANIIAQSITTFDFIKAIVNNDYAPLKAIQYNGAQLLNEAEIAVIIQTLRQDNLYESIECLRFEDLPQIIVTKHIDEGGIKKPVIRRISQLSLGQQQSVLLGILLLSNSTKPLLIDQPEDNLDSEFIFKTIVANLRKIKEHRQVIIVTHNPNIAVLGDAELIIPLKSSSVRSKIMSPGSIDNPDTVRLCCQILEGGESAFKQRQNLYGF